jgi:RecG-like helicase
LTLRPRRLDEAPSRLPIAALRGLVVDGPIRDETSGGGHGKPVDPSRSLSIYRIAGIVVSMRMFRQGGRRSTLRVAVKDESGQMDALFFNQPWLRDLFSVGDEVELLGSLVNTKNGPALLTPRVARPDRSLPEPGALEPIYSLTEGVGQEYLRGLIHAALDRYGPDLQDCLSDDQLAALGFPKLSEAVQNLHKPASQLTYGEALSRLAFEGLLKLSAELHKRRLSRQSGRALRVSVPGFEDDNSAAVRALEQLFPFPFTGAQKRTLRVNRRGQEWRTGRVYGSNRGARRAAFWWPAGAATQRGDRLLSANRLHPSSDQTQAAGRSFSGPPDGRLRHARSVL